MMLTHVVPTCFLVLLLGQRLLVDTAGTNVLEQLKLANLTWPVTTIYYDGYQHFLQKAHALGIDLIAAINDEDLRSIDAQGSAVIKVSPTAPFEDNAANMAKDDYEDSIQNELASLIDNATTHAMAEVAADVIRVQKAIAQAKTHFAADNSSTVCTYYELLDVSPPLAEHVELVIDKLVIGDCRFAIKSLTYLTSAFERCTRLSYRTKTNYLGWRVAKKFLAEAQSWQVRPEVDATRAKTADPAGFNWLLWVLTPVIIIAAIAAVVSGCFVCRCRRQRLRARLAAAAADEPQIHDDPAEQHRAYEASLLLPRGRRPNDDEQTNADHGEQPSSSQPCAESQCEEEPAPTLPPRNVFRPTCAAPPVPSDSISVAAAARCDSSESSDTDSIYATVNKPSCAAPSRYATFRTSTERVVFSPPIVIYAKPPPCQDAETQTNEA